MSTRNSVTVEVNGRKAVVRSATVNDGITFRRLYRNEPEEIANDQDYHELWIALYIFIAAVVDFDGHEGPLTFQEFCELEQAFVNGIFSAVKQTNAQWFEEEETPEKKA